jgi:hypothetical protein
MALSGTWSFSVTRDDIIKEAMLNIGAIGESEVPTAQEVTDCARKLNMLVKQWQGTMDFAPGLKMWTRQRGDLFLGNTKFQYQLGPTGDNWAAAVTGGGLGQTYAQTQLTLNAAAGATTLTALQVSQMNVSDYVGIQINLDIFWTTISSINTGAKTFTIPSPGIPNSANGNAYVWNYTTKAQRPLEIVTCILRDINNNDTPLNRMTLQDYEILPSKTQTTFTSDPTAFYYESQFTNGLSAINGNGQLYIDVGGAQDVTKHLHLVYLRPVMDFNNPGDNPEYPQQWYRPLCWGLAREICGMFDAIWTPDMDQNYREAMAMAREADTETTSFYFQPYAESPFSP